MQQLWDKLRRKVSDVQSKLPEGAGPSVVNDDFGDVLGVFLRAFHIPRGSAVPNIPPKTEPIIQ